MQEVRRPEEGTITDEAIEKLKGRIGIERPRLEPPFEFACVDALRNYARGIGDINPFYRDPEYARSTRVGKFVAHPTFMLYMGVSDKKELSEEDVRRSGGRGDPLAGVHAFYAGHDLEWFQYICEGDRLKVKGGLGNVEVKSSRMGGRAVHETHELVFWNQRGELVGVSRQLLIRVERSAARSRGRYMNLDVPHRYTPEELARIEADYEREYIRGSEPRFWEDVEVGEEMVPLVKGPYTVTAYICYCEATGPRNAFHRAHSDAYRYRKEHPRAFPPNDYGFPDTVARVHWDREMARRAGLPETYDFGGERVAWMEHAVTNWMGDDGFLRRLQVRILGFCFVGDTTWIGGRVTRKWIEHGERFVELDLWADNQRGERTTTATAWVLLPSREAGPVKLPARVPDNISIFA